MEGQGGGGFGSTTARALPTPCGGWGVGSGVQRVLVLAKRCGGALIGLCWGAGGGGGGRWCCTVCGLPPVLGTILCDASPAPEWEGRRGAAAPVVSSRTKVSPSHTYRERPPAVRYPTPEPTGWPPNPPSPRVEDSPLKRRTRVYTRKYPPACPLSHPPNRALVGLELASAALMPVAPPPDQAPCGYYTRKRVCPSFPTERVCTRGLREGDELTHASLRNIR